MYLLIGNSIYIYTYVSIDLPPKPNLPIQLNLANWLLSCYFIRNRMSKLENIKRKQMKSIWKHQSRLVFKEQCFA